MAGDYNYTVEIIKRMELLSEMKFKPAEFRAEDHEAYINNKRVRPRLTELLYIDIMELWTADYLYRGIDG